MNTGELECDIVTLTCQGCSRDFQYLRPIFREHTDPEGEDLPVLCKECEQKESDRPSWQTHACFGNNCAEWAAGATHKCETGKCKKYWDAVAEWEAAQKRRAEGEQDDARDI